MQGGSNSPKACWLKVAVYAQISVLLPALVEADPQACRGVVVSRHGKRWHANGGLACERHEAVLLLLQLLWNFLGSIHNHTVTWVQHGSPLISSSATVLHRASLKALQTTPAIPLQQRHLVVRTVVKYCCLPAQLSTYGHNSRI